MRTGLALLPMGIGTLAGTVLGAGLHRKIGARPIVVAGGVLLALGALMLRDLKPTTDIGSLWPALGLVGLSFTLFMVPAQRPSSPGDPGRHPGSADRGGF